MFIILVGVIQGGYLPDDKFHGDLSYKHESNHYKADSHTVSLHPEQLTTHHNPVHIHVKGVEKQEGIYLSRISFRISMSSLI